MLLEKAWFRSRDSPRFEYNNVYAIHISNTISDCNILNVWVSHENKSDFTGSIGGLHVSYENEVLS